MFPKSVLILIGEKKIKYTIRRKSVHGWVSKIQCGLILHDFCYCFYLFSFFESFDIILAYDVILWDTLFLPLLFLFLVLI